MLLVCAPPAFGLLSGGYRYNARVVAELARRGGARLLDTSAAALGETVRRVAREGDVVLLDSLHLLEQGIVAALASVPAVALVHALPDMDPTCPPAVSIRWRRVADDNLRAMRGAIVPSGHLREVVRRRLGATFPVAVCPPGVDTRAPAPLPPVRELVFLTIANWFPNKGHLALVHAFSRVAHLPWTWTLVGSADVDPTHARAVSSAIDGAGLASRTRRLGALPPAGVQAELDAAHVLVQASGHEAYGMVFAEALAAARPAVAFRAGGIAEIVVHGATGLLCAPGDVQGLAAALERLLRDRELVAALHAGCLRERARLRTWAEAAHCLGRAVASMTDGCRR